MKKGVVRTITFYKNKFEETDKSIYTLPHTFFFKLVRPTPEEELEIKEKSAQHL